MSLFAKFCQGKDVGSAPAPVESALPNQFDAGRRTSVSAECWIQACDSYQCMQSARLPPKAGSRTAAAMAPRRSSVDDTTSSANGTASPTPTPTTIPTSTTTQLASPANATPSPTDSNANIDILSNFNNSSIPSASASARIASSLRNTIFFAELSNDLMCQVLSALQLREVDANVAVITQGDEGDELFVLDEGAVEFVRDNKRVGEASSGSTFGELALLYNAPRAATVRTLKPSIMYTLDRITFKRIMVAKLSRKRVHSQQVLASIDAFAGLPESTQLRIADALDPQSFQLNEVVINQGDSGYEFYLIDEGTVNVSINGEVVGSLGPGSYFGELALIYDLPRAATITVTSQNLKVEVLSSAGFEQLIGPELVAELRKRDPRK